MTKNASVQMVNIDSAIPAESRRVRLTIVMAIAALLSVMFVGSPAEKASAYTLVGCKFPTSSIPYSGGAGPSGYSNLTALLDWVGNTDITGMPTTTTATPRIDFQWDYFGASGWSGLTAIPNCSSTGGLHAGVVSILINRSYLDSYSVNDRTSVTSHEIGHAIGLDHVGTSGGACATTPLMNGYDAFRWSTCGIYLTQTDDRNGANYLY